MAGYVPGEQPQTADWVKLNTNENPYPPSPRVVEAIQQAATGRLNVYPDPLATNFRKAASALFNVDPDWILPANGSDENLTVIVRAFCDADDLIAYPYPSYVLYESLAEIQGCRITRLPLDETFHWDANQADEIRRKARIFFVPNPNSPTGNLWTPEELQQVLPTEGVLVLDEAYADFADTPHQGELLQQDVFDKRMIVTRTLSKSYSLAGIRFGFAVAHPDLIAGMRKVKDSYNCDAVALAAATAAILDQDWMLQNRAKILATRKRLSAALSELGFEVFPSQANFVWMYHPSGRHQDIYEQLKQNHVLVRYMKFPDAEDTGKILDGLRITVGTDTEINRLLEVLTQTLPTIT
jgi:histidinol-phosphate aminotransferase